MSDEFKYDVFLSHNSQDKPRVRRLAERLKAAGVQVWLDEWVIQGTNLLGVKAVITKSFERIHRSNLVGMGVLPCNFKHKDDYDKVKDQAGATFSLLGVSNDMKPMSEATLRVTPAEGPAFDLPVIVRIDTPIEIDYYRAGGILPYVLAQILRANP